MTSKHFINYLLFIVFFKMLNPYENFYEERKKILVNFESSFKNKRNQLSNNDQKEIISKIDTFKNSFNKNIMMGCGMSLFILWNIRGLGILSPSYKIFATLFPAFMIPACAYYENLQKIQVFETFIAIKYTEDIL